MNRDKYPPSAIPWTSSPPYAANGSTSFAQNVYGSTTTQAMSPVYDNADPRSMQSTYPSPYYNNSANYSPTSQYSPVSPTSPSGYGQGPNYRAGHHIPRPQSTAPHTHYSQSPSHSYSNSYSQPPSTSAADYPPMGRVRSHSQAQKLPPPTNPYPQPQYIEIPIPQTISISSESPTSPQRPYSCDLCALSFNRQHDLKRHRETHTGEKPFLCNGGCGKTFTRKDALKRHQLVKGCGQVEEVTS